MMSRARNATVNPLGKALQDDKTKKPYESKTYGSLWGVLRRVGKFSRPTLASFSPSKVLVDNFLQ